MFLVHFILNKGRGMFLLCAIKLLLKKPSLNCRFGLGKVVGGHGFDDAGKENFAKRGGDNLAEVITSQILNSDPRLGPDGEECYLGMWVAMGMELTLLDEDGTSLYETGLCILTNVWFSSTGQRHDHICMIYVSCRNAGDDQGDGATPSKNRHNGIRGWGFAEQQCKIRGKPTAFGGIGICCRRCQVILQFFRHMVSVLEYMGRFWHDDHPVWRHFCKNTVDRVVLPLFFTGGI